MNISLRWRRFNARRDHYVPPPFAVTLCGLAVDTGRFVDRPGNLCVPCERSHRLTMEAQAPRWVSNPATGRQHLAMGDKTACKRPVLPTWETSVLVHSRCQVCLAAHHAQHRPADPNPT